jgi:hypothetical protein
MINYDKWKLLNENFMSSQPLGIKKNNGFLAYNKLHEDEEIEDDDVEDMDDEDMEDMDGEDMEDDDMEDMDDEDMEDDDMEDMDGEEYEDEDMEDEEYEDEDHEEMEDEEYEDMEQEEDEDDEYEIEHEQDEDGEDEGPMMGRVRSHHHSHDKHLSRPHHEMDTDEIDFAAKASDKMSRMYASCESMEYKMPSMNEWLSSVNGMMFPEELNDYIGKKGNVISEAKEEDFDVSSRFNPLVQKIEQLQKSKSSIKKEDVVGLIKKFVGAVTSHLTGNLPAGMKTRLDQFMAKIDTFLKIDDSEPEEKSILDRTKPSMNSPKYMKKGCGMSMKMMPKKMKNMKKMPKKMKMSSKNMKSCSSKNMKKSTKR